MELKADSGWAVPQKKHLRRSELADDFGNLELLALQLENFNQSSLSFFIDLENGR